MVMEQLRKFFHGDSPAEEPAQPETAAEQTQAQSPQPPAPPQFESPTQTPAQDAIPQAPAPSGPPPGTPEAQDILTLEKIKQMDRHQINQNWPEVSKIMEQQRERR